MRCVELFAGAGGAALGIEAAGFEHAALVERDPDACAVLRAAGLAPVVEADVRDLDAVEAVAGSSCDLVWSSWPCQPWSTAGSRKGEHDERNGWPWTVDAIDRFRPAWFLGENVRGLLSSDYFADLVLLDLRRRFRHVGHWLLDAADYGVPQHRRRVFVWAGPVPLVPPARSHGPGMFTRPWKTMGDALSIHGIVDSGLKGSKRSTERPSSTIRDGNGTGPTFVPNFVLHHSRNTDAHPTQERPTPAIGGRGNQMLERPAPTVTTADGQGVGSADSRDIIERAIGRRRLTPAECATLQGFPDGYPWHACRTKSARYRAIGNAVPPALAQAVAATVVDACRR